MNTLNILPLDVGSDFTSGQSIALKFTNNNSSGTIDIFTDDGSTYIAPNITIQAVGTTTLWGSSINNIAIGDGTPSTGAFTTLSANSMNISGHILPTSNNLYDLGSSTKTFRHIYVGPGSLYVNETIINESNTRLFLYNRSKFKYKNY